MEVFSGEEHNPAERIYFLKREVLQVHAALSPLVAVLDQLAHRRVKFVHEDMQEYFRDVYDHLVRMVDKISQFSDLLSSVLAANLTQVGVRQNQDMRKIAAWAAILAVPTALAGVYGMNFEHMPELAWHLGYPAALATMALACLLMYRKFRSIGWL
jgi:magnesium transporter